MPNGGSDNCGRCPFNQASMLVEDNPHQLKDSFCTIRNLPIRNPLWTYCWNRRSRSEKPQGPVFTQGIYENGYCRIPWNGKHEPRSYVAGKCEVCGRIFKEQGIEVLDNNLSLQFCCNAHYIQWWKDKHRGVVLPYEYIFEDPDTAKKTDLHGIYTELFRKSRVF